MRFTKFVLIFRTAFNFFYEVDRKRDTDEKFSSQHIYFLLNHSNLKTQEDKRKIYFAKTNFCIKLLLLLFFFFCIKCRKKIIVFLRKLNRNFKHHLSYTYTILKKFFFNETCYSTFSSFQFLALSCYGVRYVPTIVQIVPFGGPKPRRIMGKFA